MTKLLVIDTETGGTDPATHSLLSLAVVVWSDGEVAASTEILIAETPLVVTPGALEINRIDLVEHCKRAVSPALAMETLLSFLRSNFVEELAAGRGGVTLAGHNVHFDIGFLKRLCAQTGASFEKLFSHRALDTAGLLRFLMLAGVLPVSSASSTEAFRHFGIPIDDTERHTALGDARATARLISKLIELVHSKAAIA